MDGEQKSIILGTWAFIDCTIVSKIPFISWLSLHVFCISYSNFYHAFPTSIILRMLSIDKGRRISNSMHYCFMFICRYRGIIIWYFCIIPATIAQLYICIINNIWIRAFTKEHGRLTYFSQRKEQISTSVASWREIHSGMDIYVLVQRNKMATDFHLLGTISEHPLIVWAQLLISMAKCQDILNDLYIINGR